jgi:glycine oxidase
MLAPYTEARFGEELLLRLNLASWRRWPAFAAELEDAAAEAVAAGSGIARTGSGTVPRLGYREDGTVVAALDADDRAALRDEVDRQRALGLDVDELSVSELRDLEPALAPGVRRGVLAAGERSVDPAALVAVLEVAAEAAGVVVRRQRVAGLVLGSGGERVVGVQLEGGERVGAGTVVLAAGAWSADVAGLPRGVRVPVRPVKGQVVVLRQRAGDLVVRHTVRGLVRGASVYLVPRDDGRVVCGATVEERGWDRVVTAGAAYELLRDVLALFPGFDEAELVGVRAGFRPGTPDDLPLIGPGGVDGLVLATGHFRNGILLAPITADAVAALVTGSAVPDEVVPCDPARFSEPSVLSQASLAQRGQSEGIWP